MTTLTIGGGVICDIRLFYAKINHVIMADDDWSLGESLDALDDMLRGGYGAVGSFGKVKVVWRDIEVARSCLGANATEAPLHEKLERPGMYDAELIGRQIEALNAGTGPTYFETVIEIFAGRSNSKLVPV